MKMKSFSGVQWCACVCFPCVFVMCNGVQWCAMVCRCWGGCGEASSPGSTPPHTHPSLCTPLHTIAHYCTSQKHKENKHMHTIAHHSKSSFSSIFKSFYKVYFLFVNVNDLESQPPQPASQPASQPAGRPAGQLAS